MSEQLFFIKELITRCLAYVCSFRKCSSLRINNYYTGNDQCKYEFNRYLLHSAVQYQPLYRHDCRKCGFLGLGRCCTDVHIGNGRREINLYGCDRNISQQLSSYDSATIQSTYVFGGSYTSAKVNPVTNARSCPSGLSVAYNIDGVEVCLAERIISDPRSLPRYGGIYSCQYGNVATRSRTQTCPEGYSAYAMGTIDGNCLLEVCLKFVKLDDRRGLPSVALPPFFQIDTAYTIVDGNNTSENDTISGRMLNSRYFINANTSLVSQSNHIKFSLTIVSLCIGAAYYIGSSI